jgi:hypothetical protein
VARHQQPLCESPRTDFAETLWGTAAGETGARGRIQFEPLEVVPGTAHPLSPVVTILNAPKPTYYPNYLVQEFTPNPAGQEQGRISGRRYATLMNRTPEGEPVARLRGWKQYWARADGAAPEHRPLVRDQRGNYNYDTATCFCPLDRGTRFRGRIHVHNLRPAELGALVWVLTWGGRATLRHRLGMGKPLGYGSVQMRLCVDTEARLSAADGTPVPLAAIPGFADRFIELMDDWSRSRFGTSWAERPQVRAALALADPATPHRRKLQLHHPRNVKDFAQYKRLDTGDGEASYALLPIPGVDLEGPESIPPEESELTEPPPTPPLPPPPPRELPDLQGMEVAAVISGRAASGDPLFRFQAHGDTQKGRVIPELRRTYARRNFKQGVEVPFQIVGPPDADGRYPLAKPEE